MGKFIIREKRIQKNGSPYFNISLPLIAADGGVAAYMANQVNAQASKYLPLDFIELTNMSGRIISLQLDDGDTFIVPDGVIKTISDKPFRRFRVVNLDAVNDAAIDTIIIQMQRLPITMDTFIRKFKLK